MASQPTLPRSGKPRDPKLELSVFLQFREQYNHGLFHLRLKHYIEAFNTFQNILPLIAIEPMIWVRIAECCIGAHFSYRPVQPQACLVDLGLHKPPRLLVAHDITQLQSDEMEDILSYGITMQYAEMAITNAESYVKESDDLHLRRYILTLSAFIAMKMRRFRKAMSSCAKALNLPPGRMRHQQFVTEFMEYIMGECAMKDGNFERAQSLYEELLGNLHENRDGDTVPDMIQAASHQYCLSICMQGYYEAARKIFLEDLGKGGAFTTTNLTLGYYIHGHLDLIHEIIPVLRSPPPPYSPADPVYDSEDEETKEEEDLRSEIEAEERKDEEEVVKSSSGVSEEKIPEPAESPESPIESENEGSEPIYIPMSPAKEKEFTFEMTPSWEQKVAFNENVVRGERGPRRSILVRMGFILP